MEASPPFLPPYLPPKMVKWSDCADIDFGPTSPRLQMRTLHMYIRSLNVKTEDLIGIAAVFESRNQVVRLTFQKPEVCALFLSQNKGIREAKLENRDISILIKDSNVEEKFVRLSGVPQNMKKGVIEQRFKEFGKVLDTRWERYHVAGDEFLYPVLSTWMIIRMTLDKPIPSYVNVGDYRALVKYIGQKPTCRLCDEPDHIGKQCPRAKTGNQTEVAPVSVPSVQKQTPSPNEEPAKQTNVEENPEISSHDKSIADNLSSDGEEEEEVAVGRSRSSTQPVVSLQEMEVDEETQLSASQPLTSRTQDKNKNLTGSTGSLVSAEPAAKKKSNLQTRLDMDISKDPYYKLHRGNPASGKGGGGGRNPLTK